jgi:two-component system sensor histidine kinase YesM
MTLLGVVLYYSVGNIFLDDTLKDTEQTIHKSAEQIELYIDKLKGISYFIANDPHTISYIESNEFEAETELLIENAMYTDSFINSIIIASIDGRILSNEASINMTVSDDMMSEPWYVSAISSNLVLTGARMTNFSMDKDDWVISIRQEIMDSNGDNIGLVIIDVKYLVIDQLLEETDLGSDGYSFILNDHGDVVYHNDTRYFTDSDLKNDLVDISTMYVGYHQEMNKLTYTESIEGTNWSLYGVSSLDGLDVFRRQLLETLILVEIVLMILVIGTGFYIANIVTKPIKKLENAMLNINQTFMKLDVDEISSHEIKSLANHFNDMIDEIKRLMNEVTVNEKYLRTYELNALHSQINPHFLYNTLDTIVWMAEFEDSEAVINITKSLANFFRLSLSKGKELITLEDEISHAREYLFIQKQRYDEKLSYDIEVDDALLNVMVPKIIIQPIVENAIYHGIKELDGNGFIKVLISKKGDRIEIIVSDDGVGMSQESLDRLRSKLNDMNTTTYVSNKKLGGVGILNVHQRIKLYYGEEFGINVESSEKKGTVVIISMGLTIKST